MVRHRPLLDKRVFEKLPDIMKWHNLSEITKVWDNQCNILMVAEFFVWTYPGLVWPTVKNFIKFENSFRNDSLPNFQIQVEEI